MGFKKWKTAKCDIELAKELSTECDIDQFLSLLLVNRGIDDICLVDEFFDPNPDYDDPLILCDMEAAAERILTAINLGEKIAIFGDYDCDGVTATAILYKALTNKGANVIYYIPDRVLEGYGMNIPAIDFLKSEGVNLIVTVDNGVNANSEIEYANTLGIDTVVTDHHLPQGELPNAVAVVDPHRADDTSGYEYLSGVGVALKLISALDYEVSPSKHAYIYSQIVALGTIGDVVPLIKENRSVVRNALEIMNIQPTVGIRALLERISSGDKTLTSQNISFMLVPRINAAGRMGDSKRAVRLLTTDNLSEAREIAAELERDNQLRQKLCEEVYAQALAKIERDSLYKKDIIMCYGEGWHAGIIGIVAARIVERFSKPAILFTKDGDTLHGSGRSIEGNNIFEAISFAKSKTVVFGGHELAAGVTLKEQDFNAFYDLLTEYFASCEPIIPTITLDCNIKPQVINTELFDLLCELEPYGSGNSVPLFGLIEANIINIISLKDGKYTKIIVEKDDVTLSALCFNIMRKDFMYNVGQKVDIAFTLDSNEYMGDVTVNLIVKDIRPSNFNEEQYFGSMFAYNRLKKGNSKESDLELLLPQRDDFKLVYLTILNANHPVEHDYINCRLHTLGIGKISIILDAFMQYGLIVQDGTKFSVNNNAEKVDDILNAEVIKNIRKAGG